MWQIPETGVQILVNKKWIEGRRRVRNLKGIKVPFANDWIRKDHILKDGTFHLYGIKRVIKQNYDSKNYVGEYTEVISTSEILGFHTNLVPRYTVIERKESFQNYLKQINLSFLRNANDWINNYYAHFDPSNPKSQEWQQYSVSLRQAHNQITSEINSFSDYDLLIKYINNKPNPEVDGWRKYIPESPEED